VSIFPVVLRCPQCRYRWLAATVDRDRWWAAGVTPDKIATLWYCPKCRTRPPMGVEKCEIDKAQSARRGRDA